MNKFNWGKPEQNFVMMPKVLIDALPTIDSAGELKVIIYILRHTWGFNEYEEGKLITIDEFCNGRKRRNGTRIDNGCGMAENSIRLGIQKAVEHGFIEVEEDNRDKARQKRYYKLSEWGAETEPQKLNPGVLEVEPLPSVSIPLPSEVEPRSERNTFRENPKEKGKREIASAGSLPPSLLPDGNTFQDQGIAQPQATPIPPVAVAPLSPVAQALADAANEQFEDRQPQGDEYLPGLEKPKKNKQAKISEINTAAARQFGIDAKTFRLMVDAYLTGMGELIAANGTGQMATEIHQNAQSTVLEIIETSVVKFPDETAIAKLFKSYKSYNSWQDSKPSKMQLFKHASGIAAGMFSIDGMPAPTGQAQPAQGSKWQKQPAAPTTAEQMAARMNVFNKPYVAEK